MAATVVSGSSIKQGFGCSCFVFWSCAEGQAGFVLQRLLGRFYRRAFRGEVTALCLTPCWVRRHSACLNLETPLHQHKTVHMQYYGASQHSSRHLPASRPGHAETPNRTRHGYHHSLGNAAKTIAKHLVNRYTVLQLGSALSCPAWQNVPCKHGTGMAQAWHSSWSAAGNQCTLAAASRVLSPFDVRDGVSLVATTTQSTCCRLLRKCMCVPFMALTLL